MSRFVQSLLQVRILAVFIAAGLVFGTESSDAAAPSKKKAKEFTTGSSDVLIQFINDQIKTGWTDNEVDSSEVTDDAEWIRRVYLDVIGHIPPGDALESFLKDDDPAKRSKVIEKLLADPAYVRNWTTIWTNLCIGQQTPRRVSREGMQQFFREAFAKNRPWDKIVYDIVSAEGRFDEEGAVNYLLAQIEIGGAEQVTAMTTKLFMGMQVQCTQCHNHPFNDWKQDQFWQFNSFFRQMRKQNVRKYDPKRGRMVDDYSLLTWREFSGPVFYEKRSGLMQVAYPQFFDKKVDPGENTDRRTELAKLMIEGEKPYIASAMVNRTWSHFFGYGFTKPIDDMGPHNPSSHPDLLDRLAVEFVKSGYDVKQLIRWVTNSKAYNLTSRYGKNNAADNPGAGEVPLFSHMYVKSMTAEQLYDSLIIATEAHKSGRSSWEQSERQRQQWMRQFITTFGTDEGGESTTFNGTIPQALMLMNGDLVLNAINGEKGGYLHTVINGKGNDASKIRRLYLSTLNRPPSRAELSKASRLMRGNREPLSAYQDLLWALLNSNEFIFNH